MLFKTVNSCHPSQAEILCHRAIRDSPVATVTEKSSLRGRTSFCDCRRPPPMLCHPLSADVTPQCAIRQTPAEEPSRDGATSDPERQKVGFTDMPSLFQRHRPHRAIGEPPAATMTHRPIGETPTATMRGLAAGMRATRSAEQSAASPAVPTHCVSRLTSTSLPHGLPRDNRPRAGPYCPGTTLPCPFPI